MQMKDKATAMEVKENGFWAGMCSGGRGLVDVCLERATFVAGR